MDQIENQAEKDRDPANGHLARPHAELGTCCFCEEFTRGLRHPAVSADRIVLSSRSTNCIPSLGALVPGHMLMVPHRHATSISAMGDSEFEDFLMVRRQLISRLRATYGPVFQFEHGTGGSTHGGCGIDHAHLHVLPLTMTLSALSTSLKGMSVHRVDGISAIRTLVPPYLFIEDSEGASVAAHCPTLPSQFMRRAINAARGESAWDWRKMLDNTQFARTLREFRRGA